MPSLTAIRLCQYHYDPLDRLIASALPNKPEHQRFYRKSRLATEIQGALHYSIVQHDDQLLAQKIGDGNAFDTTLLATDQQRSVLQTLQANDQRQAIAYSAYGHRPVENGLLSLLGFNGERPDSVTGHYLLGNGYRAFNPVLMRFNSPDSLSPFGKGGLNPYSYCEGDSINRCDPSGNAAIPNFLSNAFRRLREAFNKPEPIYKSGQERTFTNITIKNYLNPDRTWTEQTFEISHGRKRLITIVTGDDRRVNKFENGIWTSRKHNSTLQELSYTKITPHQMRFAPRQLPYQIDMEVDRLNFHNAADTFTPMIMQQEGIPWEIAVSQANNLAILKAMNGELAGVHPEKMIELIRIGKIEFR
ncbi:RHS repeat-associated core domain-containing protein [Pseudomonas sp. GM55]|uniref:RHS repeat-associated core domain-containing protein n=1 Tax=Pseudomonas sp. GM55 TaxID=1144333 RepID=UPI0002706FA9|nr:RHS repeat-associated core domain-containing protein [Pseudomonas sp. GM55]EJM72697.1 RHS repeat-associated core domain protein-containing protein [Pseudomonas sp. GM55]